MRFAVIAALVVHAVLIAWFASREPDPAWEPTAPAATPSTPTETTVEIVLFDEPAPVPVTTVAEVPVARATAVSNSRRSSRIAKTASAPTATSDAAIATAANPSDAAPTTSPPARNYFGMRRPDLSPAHVVVDRGPATDGAGVAQPAASSGELLPSGRGTYTTDLGGSGWRDRTATAHVARDGTVKFENAPDFDIHYAGIALVGKFNADDWLARKAGIDPYASAKRAYLDRTRDERARIAEVNRSEDLSHAQRAMKRNVDAARTIADPAARKQALFELWDDVAETGDETLVTAGSGARAYLVGAIRAMRPTLAFTPDELVQLNAHRHSRAVFAPYE